MYIAVLRDLMNCYFGCRKYAWKNAAVMEIISIW